MDSLLRVTDSIKSFREARLSGLRPPTEFFDVQRISRPADLNQATSRISYNTRYFSGNYGLIVAVLAVYAIISKPFLLMSFVFLVGGFTAINRFAPDATQVGEHTITQKHLYTALFVIGVPLVWLSDPFSAFFWFVGASGILILAHASLIEPGIESEYATVQDAV